MQENSVTERNESNIKEEEYLEKAHQILKKTLFEFDRVCRENSIQYYLICGSLLGAVRHQDLIPWDDDVDVALTREEYNKLLQIAKVKWSTGEFLWVRYSELGHNTFLDFMNRLVYMKEEIPVNIFNKIKGKGREDIQNHLAIDIYILDKASNDERKHNRQVKTIMGLYGLAMGHRAYINYKEYENKDNRTQIIIKLLSTLGKIVPLKFIFWLYEKVCIRYNKEKTKDYFESNGWIYCIPWRFPQEWFLEGIDVDLAGQKIIAPKNYDAFLKKHYGNYMKLPAKSRRKPTHAATSSGIYH